MATDYTTLLTEYPEVISMDQLYRICHISKRKARWLLEHKIIPCEDSGKKTRRFKIRTLDVVHYLHDAECSPHKVATPVGIFTNSYRAPKPTNPIREIPLPQFRKYLQSRWADAPDALEVKDIVQLTGYTSQTVGQWICRQQLKHIHCPDGVKVAKTWLITFITSNTLKNPYTLPEPMRTAVNGFLEI